MPHDASPAPPLRRASGDRVLLGVCGGIARTLDVRPLLVRAAAALLAALAFPLVLAAYAAGALIVPRDDGRVLLGGEPADGREQLLGWTVVLSAGFLLLAAGFEPGQLVWPALSRSSLLLAGFAIVWLAIRDARGPAVAAAPAASGTPSPAAPVAPGAPSPAAPPAGVAPASSGPAAAVSADAAASTAASAIPPLPVPVSRPAVPAQPPAAPPADAADETAVRGGTDDQTAVRGGAADRAEPPADPADEPTAVLSAAAPTAVHVPTVPERPRRKQRTGLLVAGTIALVLAAIATAGAVALAAIGGVGDRSERPATAGDLHSQYRLGVGSLDLDLRDVSFPAGATDLRARVAAGSLTVFLPRGVRVESVGPTEPTGVARVNRLAREVAAERRSRAAAADSARRGSGRRGDGDRAAARRAGSRARVVPPVLQLDADVALGSASVVAPGG
ncbi:PspC domain-containing protein [Conexibacter arvalis]|uniref:Phage shock protein PspC (Stress-responsive transcriptional regulator) n=1 Tax=Conexibacter arvalis TaxID=912552 RepID=A0A840IAH5_9ACTN|nr:PspC domain-containing protein [Conexibacter arvalis]MBB4661253.1 phage shock protein PspC (stress-responsive transcriptional regulator) [Conexibacter arvalis]